MLEGQVGLCTFVFLLDQQRTIYSHVTDLSLEDTEESEVWNVLEQRGEKLPFFGNTG